MESKKEKILNEIELRIKEIKETNIAYNEVYYQNDIGYVDRQYLNITQQDIEKNGVNWVVINELKEEWQPLVGGSFENKILIQIVAFTQVLSPSENLSSKMNSLQKDIMLAILKDVELNNMCSYIVPVSNTIVDNLLYPYGGFSMQFEVTYVTQGLEI